MNRLNVPFTEEPECEMCGSPKTTMRYHSSVEDPWCDPECMGAIDNTTGEGYEYSDRHMSFRCQRCKYTWVTDVKGAGGSDGSPTTQD